MRDSSANEREVRTFTGLNPFRQSSKLDIDKEMSNFVPPKSNVNAVLHLGTLVKDGRLLLLPATRYPKKQLKNRTPVLFQIMSKYWQKSIKLRGDYCYEVVTKTEIHNSYRSSRYYRPLHTCSHFHNKISDTTLITAILFKRDSCRKNIICTRSR